MRCQDGKDGYFFEHRGTARYAVEGVGIDDQRFFRALEKSFDGAHGQFGRSYAGSHCCCGVVMFGADVGDAEFVFVTFEEGFRDSRLYDREGALRPEDGQFADAAAQGPTGGKYRGSHHSVAAGDEKRGAEIGFRAELWPFAQKSVDLIAFDQVEIRLGLFDGLMAQADVECFPCADYLGIVGEKEREARELDGKCQIGVHHVALLSLAVPLGEHSAGNVERDHFCARFVDISDERHEAAGQRIAQP